MGNVKNLANCNNLCGCKVVLTIQLCRQSPLIDPNGFGKSRLSKTTLSDSSQKFRMIELHLFFSFQVYFSRTQWLKNISCTYRYPTC